MDFDVQRLWLFFDGALWIGQKHDIECYAIFFPAFQLDGKPVIISALQRLAQHDNVFVVGGYKVG